MELRPAPALAHNLLAGPVRALAGATVYHLGPQARLLDAAQLMARHRVSAVPVLDEQMRPLGVVTEQRLMGALQHEGAGRLPLQQLMQPAVCVPGTLDAATACRRCVDEGGVPLLLLDDDGRVQAVVTESDFQSHLHLALLAGRNQVATVMGRVVRPMAGLDSLQQAIDQMRAVNDGCVVVCEGTRPVGVVTPRDVARLLASGVEPRTLALQAVMSKPVHTVALDTSINQAAERMLAERVRHLVVLGRDGSVAGVLDQHMLTSALATRLLDSSIERERTLHKAVLDAIPDLVWLKDPDGVYLTCNPRFESLYGVPEAQIRGRTDRAFVDPELAAFFRHHDQRAVAEGRPTVNEEELTFASDGHRELLQTIKTPVRDNQGRLIGVLGIGRDVTEARRVENEFRWLFGSNPAPMFIYERATLQLLVVNDAFTRLYGWGDDDALRLQLIDLYLPEDRDTVRARVPTLHGLANLGQWRHLRRDGSLVHVVAQSHDIVYRGRDARVVVVTDVTALARGQQRDRQRLALMERLARGDALECLLDQLVRDHEALFPGSLCSVLLMDADGRHMRHGAAPSLPDFYNQAIDGLEIGPEVGCCGAAMHSAKRVVATDLETDANWAPFVDLARRAGLRSCWSEPVLGSNASVLGSFAVYGREPGEPSPEEVQHMQFSVQLAATLIVQARTARALRDSERRQRAIVQSIPDMMWLKDTQGVYRMCNAAFAQMVGQPIDAIIGRTDAELTAPERARRYREQDEQVLSSGQPARVERELMIRPTGQLLQVDLIKTPLFDDKGRAIGVLGQARDITDRKRHEQRIQRLNRSYAVLSGVNEAVVRVRDRDALFDEICRIVYKAGGFNLAWVGRVDSEHQRLQVLARHGISARTHGQRHFDLADPANAHLAQATQSDEIDVVNDIASHALLGSWRERMLAIGHRALIVVPVPAADGPRHVLVVMSGQVDHFDDEQVALFRRLAQDTAFALAFIAAEQARAEAQRFREQVIESVAGLFYALDAGGRLMLWNRRLQEVTALEPERLAQAQVSDFFDPVDHEMVQRHIRQAFQGGEARVEAALRRGDGQRTPYLFVARRLDTATGPLIVGTGVDISDRVRSEQELTRYREQLEDLVRQRTAELEAVNARLQREDQRLRAMLALSQRASGLTEQELFKQGLDEIMALTGSTLGCVRSVAADGKTLQMQAWAGWDEPPPDLLPNHVLETGRSCHYEGQALHDALGCVSNVQRALGAPVIDAGRPVMVVCAGDKPAPYDEADQRELQLLAADLWHIVQRRRTEIALGEAKVSADAASLAKSAFLANMSHEIRTPMNAVIGFAHLLRRDPLTQRQQDHLGKITDAGQHLLQVINDILDFSKIEAHKVTLEEADFPLRESLERVKSMQADAARAKQLALVLNIDPRCPAHVRGDRLRLEQVLLNLLSNAVKFTQQGRIELQVTVVAETAAGVTLRLAVIDTGIGMTAGQLDHVFEAFAQADASTTRRFGGTGLGLAISKRLVQLMQGHIGAISRPGAGSTFWVELPLQRASASVAAPASDLLPPADGPAAAAQLRGSRVLVVEDNPVNQEVTATLLAALGATVELADSGEEALQRFDARHHDLVLMDVQMPGMDGLRATAAIRARPDGQGVPIIAMTANAFAEDRAQCLAAGMNDYLAKPVEPQALERCLVRWMRALTSPAGAARVAQAPPDAQDQLRQRLEHIDSLDTVGPLSRMRGAWPLYLRMLRMFISHHGRDTDRLADPAVIGDAAALRALAHSIIGAAATVGATEVMRQAQALQSLLLTLGGRAPDAAAVQPLADALGRCLQEVQAVFDGADAAPAAAPAAPGRAELAAVQDLLLRLQPLVAAHDTAALALFERHRVQIESVLGPDGRALGQQVRNFSFGAAQRCLVQALALCAESADESAADGPRD